MMINYCHSELACRQTGLSKSDMLFTIERSDFDLSWLRSQAKAGKLNLTNSARWTIWPMIFIKESSVTSQ